MGATTGSNITISKEDGWVEVLGVEGYVRIVLPTSYSGRTNSAYYAYGDVVPTVDGYHTSQKYTDVYNLTASSKLWVRVLRANATVVPTTKA